jgi:hypothetical protein
MEMRLHDFYQEQIPTRLASSFVHAKRASITFNRGSIVDLPNPKLVYDRKLSNQIEPPLASTWGPDRRSQGGLKISFVALHGSMNMYAIVPNLSLLVMVVSRIRYHCFYRQQISTSVDCGFPNKIEPPVGLFFMGGDRFEHSFILILTKRYIISIRY